MVFNQIGVLYFITLTHVQEEVSRQKFVFLLYRQGKFVVERLSGNARLNITFLFLFLNIFFCSRLCLMILK